MDFPEITSRQHPLVKQMRSLHSSRGRWASNLFLVEGRNAVGAALENGWPLLELLCTAEFSGLAQIASSRGVAVKVAQPELLAHASEAQSSVGIIALAQLPTVTPFPKDIGELVLVIDGVSDPGNLGTLLRAADAVGADAVIVTRGSADVWSPKVVRSAAGSLFQLPILTLEDQSPKALVRVLQEDNIPLVVAQAHGGTNCYEMEWPRRCCLVLGHETRGISRDFDQVALHRTTIPIFGNAESLNAAMAGTLLMYAWRQNQV